MNTVHQAISVIIPVLNEGQAINSLIDHLRSLEQGAEVEILVVDGDPDGSTLKSLNRPGVIGLHSCAGRALQMNTGAERAGGGVLLFLHADTRLPARAFTLISQGLRPPDIMAGAFDLKIDSQHPGLTLISRVGSLRSRLTRVPYGDQAIFVQRRFFLELGGYRPIPIMEDLDLMHRIRKQGQPIVILDAPALTSPRRWEREGMVLGTLRNWGLRLLYHLGVSPIRLAGWYK